MTSQAPILVLMISARLNGYLFRLENIPKMEASFGN